MRQFALVRKKQQKLGHVRSFIWGKTKTIKNVCFGLALILLPQTESYDVGVVAMLVNGSRVITRARVAAVERFDGSLQYLVRGISKTLHKLKKEWSFSILV